MESDALLMNSGRCVDVLTDPVRAQRACYGTHVFFTRGHQFI